MQNLNRRELCVALSAFAALGNLAAEAQTSTAPSTQSAQALSQPRVFVFEELPATKMANGGESRNIVRGTLATGEVVALHESTQPAGAVPNPPHEIQHSEFIMVREGTVAFEHDGKSEKVGPGGVIYVAYGTLHAVRNVGDVPAKYFVIQIGGDTKK